uniref:Uncharacterized protein n=1 Tax=viral metagenome TaxID=1070528 RepID=A0A6C0E1M5_9ZZZZ
MSNLFEEVLTDVKGVEERLLGPDYPYYKYIKTPSEIGMTDEGSISALSKDIDGLVNYVELLVTGKGNASATGQPLGNKFFLKTGAKCTDPSNGQDVDRYIYVDNVPAGNIPFISSGLGVNFSEFKGLIPGAVSDLNVLNPFVIFQAFLSGGKQQCQEITMETIDTNNNRSTETHFVSLIDLKNMDPCVFPDKYNRFSDKRCKETFTSMEVKNKHKNAFKLPDDPIIQGYIASLGVLGIYILYCLMTKMKK